MKLIGKRILPLFLCLTLLCGTLLLPSMPVALGAVGNYYMINGKSLSCETVKDFGTGENEAYVRALYEYVWGVPYTEDFSSSDNILKNMLYEERALNPENLSRLVQRSSPGSVLRVENIEETGQSNDKGHTVFIVSHDGRGFTVFERMDERRETYYTWERFCSLYSYSTVRFLKWPNSYFASSYTNSETDYRKPDRVLYYDEDGAFSGDDVRWVQQRLTDVGCSVAVDGYFGRNTETMVKKFQQEFALEVTGIVDPLTADMLETPLKAPGAPELRLSHEADSHLSCGDILTVTWNRVDYADSYCVMLYNSSGKAVDVLDTVTGNEASFIVDKAGNYTVKAYARNARFQSEVATMEQRVRVHNTFTVRFVDDDGTLLNKQTVAYGMDAATPASPKKTGYTFTGWDEEYTNITGSMTITACYAQKAFTVTFCDATGAVIAEPQRVLYGEAAVAPDMSGTEGFIGWNKDFSFIEASTTVTAVVVGGEEGLPARIEEPSAQRESDSSGYSVDFTVCNQRAERIIGRSVVSLKTTAGKFLTMTESSAFVLEGNDRKTMHVFVPYSGAATIVEIYIVENYNDLVPISSVAVVDEISTDNSFTDWLPDEQAPESYYSTTDYRTEYSYRVKSKKDSTAPSLAGWTQYASRISSYNYSGWSSWSASAIAASELREVETKQESYVSGYQIRCWLTQATTSPYYRHYWDYNRGAERASYGVHVHDKAVSVSTWNSYKNVSPGGKSSGTYSGYNKAGQNGRYSSDGIIWYPYNTQSGSTTYYRYQDKTPVYTYSYYQWGQWSDWSEEPVQASEDVEVRTRRTRRYEVNDPTEYNTGTTRTIVGAVDSALAGKEVTLFIYKVDEASDYTNEYVGQTTIDENGVYRFTFKLREEPSVETGDFTVTLGVEGANTVFFLTPIQAPRK
ncbi:MAG: peptidoglycan-binding protein, partial [Oscillospiraceae bacterium]|nr:peptidoglycan-binding protein [Oscillospiraceae bacterium]